MTHGGIIAILPVIVIMETVSKKMPLVSISVTTTVRENVLQGDDPDAMMTRMMPVTVMLLMMVTKSIITGTMMQARVSIY